MCVKKETSRSDNRERPKFYSRIDQGDRVAIGRRSGRRYGRKITGPAATIILRMDAWLMLR
jgi:hypothetical protein